LEQLILPAVSGDLVIFVDELDLARSLKFSADDFFAGIRACYNRRADEALWRRISFCLLGVVNPGDLIPDPLITPFNIGQRITLRDFTLAEAKPLAKGLGADPETNEKTLKRIIYWTNGQPYLTQRLCAEAAAQGARRRREIDRLCDELFFRARREKDPNLDFVGKRLAPPLSDLPGVEEAQYEEYLAGRLDLYRRVRAGARVPDEETRPHVSELRLSGVARAENGLLKVRNRIYEKAFGPSWIKDKAPKQAARWREALRVASLALMIVLMAGLTALAVSQWRRAVKAEGEAQKQAQEAQAQARKAEQTAALVQEQAQAAALNQKCSGRLAFLQTNANVYSRPLLSSGASREVRDSFLIAQHFKGAKLCIVDEAQNDLGNFWYKVRVLGYGTNSVNPSWYGKKLLRDTSPEEKDRSFYLQGDDDAPDIGWVKEMDNARGLRIVSF
jgi:type II secretory pathway pseudopilin PulG